MKKYFGVFAVILSFAVLSSVFYLKRNPSLSASPEQFKAARNVVPAANALKAPESSWAKNSSEPSIPQSSMEAASKVDSDSEFNILLANANLSTTVSVAKTTQVLRSGDPIKIASYFKSTLELLAQKDSDQRERLVFIANELQSDQLLGFWQDIALRTPARFEDETKYLEFGEPTEELLSIHQELLNSVRNIGLIASRDSKAAEFLSNLILHPSSPLHDEFIRERAFISLKEADLSASIRVLKLLDKADPLRDRLISP